MAVLPHMAYCHTIWQFSKSPDRRKLKRALARATTGDLSLTQNLALTRSFFSSHGYLVHFKIEYQDMAVFMYKVKDGYLPNYIMELLHNSDKSHVLQNVEFDLPRFY